MKECVWKPEQMQVLKQVDRCVHKLQDTVEIQIFMVTKRTKLMVMSYVFASSHHSKPTLIFAKSLTSDIRKCGTALPM